MPEQPIPFPFQGISDNAAFSRQEPLTTREATNVRAIDPVTGRTRGAQRSGLSKFNTNVIAGASQKVQHLVTFTRDDDLIDYALSGGASSRTTYDQVWATATPAGSSCLNLDVDFQSNVYCLDGNAGFVKYNSDGVEQYRVSAPVADDSQIVRAIKVDDTLEVYLGVSEGNDQRDGRIWKFSQRQPDAPDVNLRCNKDTSPLSEVAWELEVNGFVQDFDIFRGELYALTQSPRDGRTFVNVYGNLFLSEPTLRRTIEVPDRSQALSIRDDGSLYVAAPAIAGGSFGQRGRPRGSESFETRWVQWRPEDLDDFQDRVWSWYDETGFEGVDAGDAPEILPGLVGWRDRSGNGRHYFDPGGGTTPPVVRENGIGGRRALDFDGESTTYLETGDNATVAASARDIQRTMLPAYTGSMFAVCMVIRYQDETAQARTVFAQRNTADATPVLSGYVRLITGLNSGDGNTGGWTVAANLSATGDLVWYEEIPNVLDAGGGSPLTGEGDGIGALPGTDRLARSCDVIPLSADPTPPVRTPTAFTPNDTTGTVVVSIIMNGGQTGSSTYRVNGRPLDIWDSPPFATGPDEPTRLGGDLGGFAGTLGFQGQIGEIIVLSDYNGGTHPATIPEDSGGTAYPEQASSGEETESEIDLLEGYLAWKWGVRGVMGDVATYPSSWQFAPPPVTDPLDRLSGVADEDPLQAKFDSTGTLLWVKVDVDAQGDDCIKTCEGADVYTQGKRTVEHGARRYEDEGEGGTSTTWELEVAATNTFNYPRMDTDEFDNVYIPWSNALGIASPVSLYAVSPNDTITAGEVQTGDEMLAVQIIEAGEADGDQVRRATAVAVDRNVPNYRSDLSGTDNRAQYLYVATQNVKRITITSVTGADANPDTLTFTGASSTLAAANWATYAGAQLIINSGTSTVPGTYGISSASGEVITLDSSTAITGAASDLSVTLIYDPSAVSTVHKLRLVTASVETGTRREQVNLAVANGDLKRYVSGATAHTTLEAGAFNANAEFIDSTVLFEQAFVIDGGNYKVVRYDSGGALEVDDYTAVTGGRIPPNAKLITNWRGRVVVGRLASNPHEWVMSAIDDPYDWDIYPPVVTSAQAIAGTASRAGQTPDIINAMVSYNDDLLYFGGDRSIYRLTGDPMSGGQMDLITDVTGMSFGRPYTKDPDGNLFFFGSRGGVYVMPYGGIPTRLSRDRIERRMQDLDLSSFYVEMVWNYRDEGLHVFVFPYGAGGTLVQHWFWDKKNDAWFEDEFGDAFSSPTYDVQPTAVYVLDGDDADDRKVAIGGRDGYVRIWDETANDDDGTAIDSRVLIGPYQLANAGREVRLSRFAPVLASDQGGCNFEMYFSDTADELGKVLLKGVLRPGRSGTYPARARGSFVALRLQNAQEAGSDNSISARWAFETATVWASMAGPQRMRSRT